MCMCRVPIPIKSELLKDPLNRWRSGNIVCILCNFLGMFLIHMGLEKKNRNRRRREKGEEEEQEGENCGISKTWEHPVTKLL